MRCRIGLIQFVLLSSLLVALSPIDIMQPWTPEQKLGQGIMMGIDVRESHSEWIALVKHVQPGGVMLYGTPFLDKAQTQTFIRQLQSVSRLPLWVAVDQEGGRVSRLKTMVTPLPPNQTIAKTLTPQELAARSYHLATEMKALGFNLNFAPVLDVNVQDKNAVIGDRSYGTDPEIVATYGCAFIKGHLAAGVWPTAKHFPGHGNTIDDSHLSQTRSLSSTDHFLSHDLSPFVQAIACDVPVMMIGHVMYPFLDPDHPASISTTIITSLLKQKLGYQGLIITDDLAMKGAGSAPLSDTIIAAWNAGNHMALALASPKAWQLEWPKITQSYKASELNFLSIVSKKIEFK